MLLRAACHEHLLLCSELHSHFFSSLNPSAGCNTLTSLDGSTNQLVDFAIKHLQAHLKLIFMRKCKLCRHMFSASMTCMHITHADLQWCTPPVR